MDSPCHPLCAGFWVFYLLITSSTEEASAGKRAGRATPQLEILSLILSPETVFAVEEIDARNIKCGLGAMGRFNLPMLPFSLSRHTPGDQHLTA